MTVQRINNNYYDDDDDDYYYYYYYYYIVELISDYNNDVNNFLVFILIYMI
jgi:hypothetical protein